MERQCRTTRQRLVILEKLRAVTSHPTADEIYAMTRERLPRVSLGTVYRNLDLLTRQGEIICLENAGFQKRFDGNTEPHYHVRCRRCGRVGDVMARFAMPHTAGARAEGFTLTGARIEFEGICHACAASQAS